MRKVLLGLACILVAVVGIAWVDVYIDLHEEPPAVVFSGEWLSSCERTEVGLACGVMSGAPDLRVTFIGVSEEVELGYTLWDANGVRVGSGLGTWVVLEGFSASVVELLALSGELDWTVVSEVSVEEAEIDRVDAVEWARTRSVLRQMQSTEGLTRMVSASEGFDFYEPTTATVTLTPLTNALDNLSFADMTLDAPTMEIASLDEILLMGNYNPGENGFVVTVNGSFLVAEPFSFKAGADDTAEVTKLWIL